MRRFLDALFPIALTAWVGALWAIGYIAAPVLFAQLADRVVAGTLAGKMFAVVGWLGMGCGSVLVLLLLRQGLGALRRWLFWLLLLMLLLSAAQLFGLQPLIAHLRSESVPRELADAATRSRFATWHGVASALYLLQSLLGLVAVLLAGRERR